MTETWKAIPGFAGYEASDLGRIRSVRGVMKPTVNEHGYLTLKLRRDGRYVNIRVNRAVLMAHVGLPLQGDVAAHRDGDKQNNRSLNLRWSSNSENEKDKIGHGRSNRGSRNGQSVLTERDVSAIIEASPTCFSEYRPLAVQYGVAPLTIYKLVKGYRWGHFSGVQHG